MALPFSPISLVENYQNKDLNIPDSDYFSFKFTNSEGNILGTSEKNTSISVYAKETQVQYIDKDANIKEGFLIVRIW